jgi:hypothetical protein
LLLVVDLTIPSQRLGGDTASAEVFRTTDGTVWSLAAPGGAFNGTAVLAVAQTASGFVAVGGEPNGVGPARFFVAGPSATGWSPASTSDSGPGEARAVVQTPPGMIAVGTGSSGTGSSGAGGPATYAVAWTSADGRNWVRSGTLDARPGLGDETPEGLCSAGTTLVAVGSGSGSSPGRTGMIWTGTSGSTWRRAPVSPAPPPGSDQSIAGCEFTGNGFVAYGEGPDDDGTASPALWRSADGAQWSAEATKGLDGAGRIADIGVRGSTWLAVGSSVVLPSPAMPVGAAGVWLSADGGQTWERLDTAGGQWQPAMTIEVDRTGFAGDTPVVAGSVDGQLAVWVGTPVP